MDVDSSTDSSSWSDIDGVSRSSDSWKTLNLSDVMDMFQVRVFRSEIACAPVLIPFKILLIYLASNSPLSNCNEDQSWRKSCPENILVKLLP